MTHRLNRQHALHHITHDLKHPARPAKLLHLVCYLFVENVLVGAVLHLTCGGELYRCGRLALHAGSGAHEDIVVSSARAYVSALNKMISWMSATSKVQPAGSGSSGAVRPSKRVAAA